MEPVVVDRSKLPVDRRTDAIDRHLHSRASPRFLAESSNVPDTTDRPELFYVEGPPEEIWLVTSTGKRVLGFSVHASATVTLDLLLSFENIQGTLITLPKPGVYIVVATFDMNSDSPVSDFIIQGILATGAGVAIDAPREALFKADGISRATIGQTWRVTTTTDNETFRLRGNRTSGSGSANIESTHTTIAAFSMLGGGSTATSHQHAHVDATGQTEDDHHDEDHNLFAAVHSDMLLAQAEAGGDIMFRNTNGKWTNLPIGSSADVLFVISGRPFWIPGSVFSAVVDHDVILNVDPDSHHLPHTAGPGIDVTGGVISHIGNAPGDLHPLYQKESEAHPDGSYGEKLRRSYLLLAMDIDGIMVSET